MASYSDASKIHLSTKTDHTTIFRRPARRKISFRRRRLPIVRLGGQRPRLGFSLVRIFRRVRLKGLKLKYSCVLKKLKGYYHSLIEDISKGGGTVESFQKRLLVETSFAIPVMGICIFH